MLTINHLPINGIIAAVSHQGLSVTTADGKQARLAIVDDAGHIIDDSAGVAAAAWNVAIESHRNFLIGQGHLRVQAGPTGITGGEKISDIGGQP